MSFRRCSDHSEFFKVTKAIFTKTSSLFSSHQLRTSAYLRIPPEKEIVPTGISMRYHSVRLNMAFLVYYQFLIKCMCSGSSGNVSVVISAITGTILHSYFLA